MKLIDEIDLFFNYLDTHLSSISELSGNSNVELYKKLIYMAFIDLLSRIVYPKRDPRNRVVSLLKNYSNWNFGQNISLPHLSRLLNSIVDPAFDEIKQYTEYKLSLWSRGELVKLDRDLNYEEVKDMWADSILTKKFNLDHLTHFHLFYSYRNSLVHELRPPSSSFDRIFHYEPFYMHLTNLSNDLKPKEHHWVLNYPVNFFASISKVLHYQIKHYCITNKRNPYDSFSFGEYWLEQLNKVSK